MLVDCDYEIVLLPFMNVMLEAGSLTGGGALTRRRPGSDAGAGAAAPAAAAEEGFVRDGLLQ